MKKTFVYILSLMCLLSIANAKDDVGYRAKEGDQALLFSLKGLDNLSAGNFNGGLGYQYYFANHTAFRFALGLDFSSESQDKPDETYAKDYSKDVFSFLLRPGIRYNFGTSSNVLAYMGTEAIFQLTKTTTESNLVTFTDQTLEEKSTNFGLGFFIGAEWFAFKNVSLSAEYGLSFLFGSSESTTKTPTQSTTVDMPKTFKTGLNSSGYLTLSFYFN